MKTKLLLVIFLSMLAFGIIAQTATAIEYGQMGGKPTNFDPNIPDSKAWFIYNLEPGVSKEDSLTVANLFNEPWIAVIYAADSIKSSSGGFALRQLTEPKEEVGTWVKFYPEAKPDFANKIFEDKKTIDEVCKVSSADLKDKYELEEGKISELQEWCKGKDVVELDLKAGEKKELLFVISIPENAEVGEHTGGILIQKKAKDESAQTDGSKVMLTTRVGVRIYETVPGNIIKKLAFTDFNVVKNFDEFYWPWDKLKKEKFKEYIISSVIDNSGNVSTNFSENIIIKNLITQKIERVDNREFQVLRGDSFTSTLAWKAPRLAYLSFQKEYTYKDAADNEQKLTSEVVNNFFIPWREMVIFIFLLSLAAGVYTAWKKYQKKYYGGIGWVSYSVKDNETIQTLSNKFKVSWKILVKTNKLKVPYMLETGQIIKVPIVDLDEVEKEKIVLGLETVAKNNLPEKEAIISDESGEELSDEDILNRKELFDSAIENEKLEDVKSEGDSAIAQTAASDSVDSSLFFVSDNIKKKEQPEIEAEKNEIEKEIKEVFSVSEDPKNPSMSAQPLKKNVDIKKSAVLSVESAVAEEEDKEESLIIENDDIVIQGSKDDTKSYFKWVILTLGLIIIILIIAVVYLLLGNKKEDKVVVQPVTVANESVVENKSQNESVVSEKKEEPVQKEISTDSLKMKIDVFNGSGVAGAAGKVKDFLESKKYENVEAKNYSQDNLVGSAIYYKEENLKQEAQWLADILKDKEIEADIKLASKDEEKSADFVIILGK